MVQAFLKKWWVESDFKAPILPLSLRFLCAGRRVWVMVFNTTLNNISAISWRSVLLVENIGVPRVQVDVSRSKVISFPFYSTRLCTLRRSTKYQFYSPSFTHYFESIRKTSACPSASDITWTMFWIPWIARWNIQVFCLLY